MDPNNTQPSNFNVPQPDAGRDSQGVDPNAYPVREPELSHETAQSSVDTRQPGVNPLTAQAPQSPLPAIAPPTTPTTPTTVSPPQLRSVQSVADDLPAADIDLIEKQWVEKAKAIVENTRNDPREQNIELSKIKAEYIKKRYDKDVKVSDER